MNCTSFKYCELNYVLETEVTVQGNNNSFLGTKVTLCEISCRNFMAVQLRQNYFIVLIPGGMIQKKTDRESYECATYIPPIPRKLWRPL